MAVTLTDRAAQHVQRYIQKRGKGVGLRLGVKTTGCSGLAYKLEFADDILPEDAIKAAIADYRKKYGAEADSDKKAAD